MKTKRMTWAGHTEHMEEMGVPERKEYVGD
jgi:hypothetical protein